MINKHWIIYGKLKLIAVESGAVIKLVNNDIWHTGITKLTFLSKLEYDNFTNEIYRKNESHRR